jgi:hypothetical protein
MNRSFERILGVSFLLCALTCSGQVTCASISQAVFNNPNSPEEMVADVPAGGTFVKYDLYLRPFAPGHPWQHCPSAYCNANATFNTTTLKDDQDGTITYHVTATPVPLVSDPRVTFTGMTQPRLVVTYTTKEKMCTSQGTLHIPAGVHRDLRLYVPPPAVFSVMKDFERIMSPRSDQPVGYINCDDGSVPVWHKCLQAPLTFQVFSGPESDQADNAGGRLFQCTSKPNNQWDGKERQCRGVLIYQPGSQPAPGIPFELYNSTSLTAPSKAEPTSLPVKDDKAPK